MMDCPEDDWACLTEEDLAADLLECEKELEERGNSGWDRGVEEKLKEALKRGAGTSQSIKINTDVFSTAQQAIQEIAGDLHAVVANVGMMQFETAALVAAIAHGPLRPPESTGSGPWIGLPARAVFGPEVMAPVPPETTAASMPASATSLEEYELRVAGLPRLLVIGRDLELSVKALDPKQDEKDINRDNLIVNSQEISGSKGGYKAAVAAIASGLQLSGTAANSEEEHLGAQVLLSALNRTCSGFVAFREVLRIFDCDPLVVVSPESAAAKPLEAAITAGVALGCAHTRYAVHRADGSGSGPVTAIDAYFHFRVDSATLASLTRDRDVSVTLPATVVLQMG
eukprot:TRINITY_DN36539_c0_g1_i1.p1 TRINITY_DN36539_c0_g1~~TRINITY_DN36539_c0_g1_i1.p1  ORF type:complete len:342 (-),score=66.48 TRINITY_DN36539_c0_g1_i1:38-1063(-)